MKKGGKRDEKRVPGRGRKPKPGVSDLSPRDQRNREELMGNERGLTGRCSLTSLELVKWSRKKLQSRPLIDFYFEICILMNARVGLYAMKCFQFLVFAILLASSKL